MPLGALSRLRSNASRFRYIVASTISGNGSTTKPDITFHALRHTHASQLIDTGVDVVTIAKRLGHSSPNVTLGVYAHLFRQKDDKAAQAINQALANLKG